MRLSEVVKKFWKIMLCLAFFVALICNFAYVPSKGLKNIYTKELEVRLEESDKDNLSFLKRFNHLEKLYLMTHNSNSDLDSLPVISGLKRLTIENYTYENLDYTKLQKFVNLEYLSIMQSNIDDFHFIIEMKELNDFVYWGGLFHEIKEPNWTTFPKENNIKNMCLMYVYIDDSLFELVSQMSSLQELSIHFIISSDEDERLLEINKIEEFTSILKDKGVDLTITYSES